MSGEVNAVPPVGWGIPSVYNVWIGTATSPRPQLIPTQGNITQVMGNVKTPIDFQPLPFTPGDLLNNRFKIMTHA